MKVRTHDELIDSIQQDKAWRTKELINFKTSCTSARQAIRPTLFKLGICLAYSHWEGFVKFSGVAFFTYIVNSGLKYNQMIDNYKVCALLEHFKGSYPHKNFASQLILVSNEINYDKSIRIKPENFIDTKSNLNSEVLEEISAKIGLNFKKFELKGNFIDESLITVRNSIAHGQYRDINYKEFEDIYDETFNLIETFFNEIMNFVQQRKFLRDLVKSSI